MYVYIYIHTYNTLHPKLGCFNFEVCFSFFTLVTGPRRSLSLKLSDTRVYEPYTSPCR